MDAQLLEVTRPQQMIDVGECRLRQRPQRLALHNQHIAARSTVSSRTPVAGELAVRGAVLPERKQRRVPIRRHSDGNGGVHFMLQVAYPIRSLTSLWTRSTAQNFSLETTPKQIDNQDQLRIAV